MKKVKLNYMSACGQVKLVKKVSISSAQLEMLNQEIKRKCKQNAYESDASEKLAGKYYVKSLINKR